MKLERPTFSEHEEELFMPINMSTFMHNGVPYWAMRGIISGGKTCTLVIKDVEIYVDVRPMDGKMTRKELLDLAKDDKHKQVAFVRRSIGRTKPNQPKSFKIIKRYPFHGFYTEKQPYVRVYFPDFQSRGSAVRNLSQTDIETSNDGYDWPAILSRRFAFNTTKWNRINMDGAQVFGANAPFEYRTDKLIIIPYSENILCGVSDDEAPRINGVCFSWDIESFQKVEGKPTPVSPSTYDIKIIGVHVSFMDGKKIADISLCQMPETDAEKLRNKLPPSIHLMNYETERELIQGFIELFKIYKPDYEQGFNSGNYDWPCIYYKAKKYKLERQLSMALSALPRVSPISFRSTRVKISADRSHQLDIIPHGLGVQSSDVMPIFYKLYQKAEIGWGASLNFFLEKNNITGKLDMPFYEMNGTFKKCTKYIPAECLDTYAKIIEYCAWDAGSLIQLYKKRNIYIEAVERGNMSYVSIHNALFKADGTRVFNIIGNIADNLYHVAFSEQYGTPKNYDYPGAFVFQPIRGKKLTPIVGFDAASLYPSTMKSHNFSPDVLVEDEEYAEELRQKGYVLNPLPDFTYHEGQIEHKSRGYVVHHNGCFSPKDKQIAKDQIKRVSMKLKSGDEKVIEYVGRDEIRHSVINERKKYPEDAVKGRKIEYDVARGRERLPREYLGIMSYAVSKLLTERKPYKMQKVELEEIVEQMHANGETARKYRGKMMKLDDLEYLLTIVNAKQLALKILANTFYGKMGEKRLKAYSVLTVSSITSSGKHDIQMIAKFLEDNNFTIHYGDTDSVYISCEKRVANELPEPEKSATDAEWKTYYEKMIERTQYEVNKINEQVRDLLVHKHNTSIMKMAYEEVLWICHLLGKKKYYGTAHIKTVNFDVSMKNTFLRGVDLVKKGRSKLMKKISTDFILRSLKFEHRYETNLETLKKVLLEFYKNRDDYTLDYFIMYETYKPDKQQSSVHRFYERLQDRGDVLPEPGNSFKYVIYKPQNLYNPISGNKITPKKGDRMEYADGCDVDKIDFSWYVTNQIAGVLSRFISFEPQFMEKAQLKLKDSVLTGDDYTKALDKESIDVAKKYIINLFEDISGDADMRVKTIQNMKETKAYFSQLKKTIKRKLIVDISDIIIACIKNSDIENYRELAMQINDCTICCNTFADTFTAEQRAKLVQYYKPPVNNERWFDNIIELLKNKKIDTAINELNNIIIKHSNYNKIKQ